MEDLKTEAVDRIMLVLIRAGVADLQTARLGVAQVLSDYDISKAERSLVVYTGGKNEYLIKKFILAKAVSGCAESTLRQYAREIARALTEIGKDADTITHEDIQFLLAKVIQRASKTYADNIRRNLSSFYAYLLREELVTHNPMYRVDKIKVQKKKKTAFSEYDVERIRNACQNWREKAIVEMLLSTGCRVNELVSIRREDLGNGLQPSINILGKGGKYRNVFLTARADITIRNYIAERKDNNPYLFPKCAVKVGEKGSAAGFLRSQKAEWYKIPKMVAEDGAQDKSVIEATLRKIGKRAGVENCHPHRFRRTCATFALRRGMPLEQVSRLLGHASLATTQIYLDLTDEELAQAHKKYVV